MSKSKTSIKSREEVRRLLENIHPSTTRATIATVACEISDARDLAKVLKYSYRNAVRLVKVMEELNVVKTVNYGRKKIILSVDSKVESEVLEGLKPLLGRLAESLKLEKRLDEQNLLKRFCNVLELNGDARPRATFAGVIKEIVQKYGEYRDKPLPKWLRKVLMFVGIMFAEAAKPQIGDSIDSPWSGGTDLRLLE